MQRIGLVFCHSSSSAVSLYKTSRRRVELTYGIEVPRLSCRVLSHIPIDRDLDAEARDQAAGQEKKLWNFPFCYIISSLYGNLFTFFSSRIERFSFYEAF